MSGLSEKHITFTAKTGETDPLLAWHCSVGAFSYRYRYL